jgi:hypothetical protein
MHLILQELQEDASLPRAIPTQIERRRRLRLDEPAAHRCRSAHGDLPSGQSQQPRKHVLPPESRIHAQFAALAD